MTDLVVFKLGQSPAEPVAWGTFASGALVEVGRVSDVDELATIALRFDRNARFVALAPGEQVAMREISAPPRQSAKLIAAAGLLLEDELAAPVSDLHIAVSSGEPRVVFAIAKAMIDDWLAAFDAAGITLTEICADYAAIGGSSATAVLVLDKGRVIASRGAAGFAVEIDLAQAIAPAFLAAAGDAAIIAYGPNGFAGDWIDKPIDRRIMTHEADFMSVFGAALLSKPAPTNLLQGAYRRRLQHSFKIGAYRRTAILAAGLASAVVVSGAAAGFKDARVASIYEQSAAAMHKAAFPTFSGGEIRSHARQMLASGVKAASFMELSARLDASLEGEDGVAIDRIRFDGARGQFTFSIRSNSDAGIEAFRASLEANGLAASDSGGYRRSGDAWIGEMSARAK